MEMWFVAVGYFLVAAVIIFYIWMKSKERLARIEKGSDPDAESVKKYHRQVTLRNGIFLLSVALGLLIGKIVLSIIANDELIVYAIALFFSCGIGLIVYTLIVKKYYS